MKKFITIFLFICIRYNIFGQCMSMPTVPSCSGIGVYDGVQANSGVTYVYAGGTSTMTIHFNGADVIVCGGKLTLSSSSGFNGGRLYILGGATVNTNQSVLNTVIYNYGTLNINNNLTVNSAGLLMNGITGNMNIYGNLSENTIITNYGNVFISGTLIISNSGSGACLGANSKLNASTIKYDWNTNPIKVASGNACVGISTTSITGNTTLTSSSSLKICANSTFSVSGGGTIGSATLNQNCISCDEALPIELIYFTGKKSNDYVLLEWATASEKNNDFFTLLKSYDGVNFNNLIDVGGAGNSSVTMYYNYKDYDHSIGINYYKLRQTDYDGKNVTSKVVSVNDDSFEFNIMVYPIPSSTPNVKLIMYKNLGFVNVTCIDVTGKVIFNTNINSVDGYEYNLGQYKLVSGIYFIKLDTPTNIYIKEFIVNN